MEHFELMEKIVNTFGVSYEKAKTILESCNWDAVEAAVILEREKNGTGPQGSQPQPERESTESEEKKGPRGEFAKAKAEAPQVLKSIWDFFSLNEFVVKKSSGEVFLSIPLWITILLFCAFFWAMIFVLVIVFIMGYRFSFNGPQFSKDNVKGSVVDHQYEKKEDIVEEVIVNREPRTDEILNDIRNESAENVESKIKIVTETVIENAPEAVDNVIIPETPAEPETNSNPDSSEN